MNNASKKPLGRKAYGSIPHLPGSRLGPGDHHCHEGQERICLEKVRDKHDRIIVTEKLDGSCTAVAKIDGQIIALGRAGYLAQSSPHVQHQMFAWWVQENEARFQKIPEGYRLVGEWCAQAHGTLYDLSGVEPWFVFDLFDGDNRRKPHQELIDFCGDKGISIVAYMDSQDFESVQIWRALTCLDASTKALSNEIEGAVWRVERKGEFDFLAKYVRPNKVDGKYFSKITGNPDVWNWIPPEWGSLSIAPEIIAYLNDEEEKEGT